MVKPLKMGQHTFPSNLIQGPLAGYSCAAMRVQTWAFSQPAYCSTEMVSATHLVYAKKMPQRYIERDPSERALCFQLSAEDHEILAQAVQKVNRLAPEIIELNCGCPVGKIRRKGAGSKLLSDPDRLKRLISALRRNTQAAISVKIRVSGESQDQDDLAIAKIAEEEGADALVVHGRHWTEAYDQPCRHAQIQRLVSAVTIPVIGNGDVHDIDSLSLMLKTGCAGVMIARASMGQPWLFSELQAKLLQQEFLRPNAVQIGEVFINHVERLAVLDSDFRAVLQARKMGKYYSRNVIASSQAFNLQLMKCSTLEDFIQLVREHFA
ncbi:MAG: tRNA-dihydrouridine synthase family protein [Pseudomonadota bacterium]|nr:tRNA-dihydrouridine synthase family protein [Pseudomonadota bacterium]